MNMKYMIPILIAIALIYGIYFVQTKQLLQNIQIDNMLSQAASQKQQREQQDTRPQVEQSSSMKMMDRNPSSLMNLGQLLSNPEPELVDPIPRMY